MMDKTEVMKDLKFCQELMDRLIKFADTHYIDCIYDNKQIKIKRIGE